MINGNDDYGGDDDDNHTDNTNDTDNNGLQHICWWIHYHGYLFSSSRIQNGGRNGIVFAKQI